MRRTHDPWFHLVVSGPIVVGAFLVWFACMSAALLFWYGLLALPLACLCFVWSHHLWKYNCIRIEENQWVERYFLGRVEYLFGCWMIIIPRFMRLYRWDSRTREVHTATNIHEPTTVVAQIFLEKDPVDIDGVSRMVSQLFALGLQISYRLMSANPALVSRTYLDNIQQLHCTLDEAVKHVIVLRLSDLVNQVFQPKGGAEIITIEDVIERRAYINAALLQVLAADMAATYATEIISILIHAEPTDLVPDGYMTQRARWVTARKKSQADKVVALSEAEAAMEQATQRRRSAVKEAEENRATIEAQKMTEDKRVILAAVQAQVAMQERMALLELYRTEGNLEAELARSFADDDSFQNLAGWVMLAKNMGLPDLAKALQKFLNPSAP